MFSEFRSQSQPNKGKGGGGSSIDERRPDSVLSDKSRVRFGASFRIPGGVSGVSSAYQRLCRPYLYAIVIPSCGGKTTCCRTFQQLDVDEILDDKTEEYIRLLRARALESEPSGQGPAWAHHNDVWYKECARTLRKIDWTNEPKVLFCHTVEVAQAVGAKILGIYLPRPELLTHNLQKSKRDKPAWDLAVMNWQTLYNLGERGLDVVLYDTNAALLVHVARAIATVTTSPGIGKYLTKREMLEYSTYRRDFPCDVSDAVLYEKWHDWHIDELVDRVKDGSYPKWTIRSWMIARNMKLYVSGVGHQDYYDWTRLGSLARRGPGAGTAITLEHIRSTTDWYEYFPFSLPKYEAQSNVRIRDLFRDVAIYRLEDLSVAVDLMNAHIGEEHTFVCSILVYWFGVACDYRDKLRDRLIKSEILLVPEAEWVETHKLVHNLVRNSKEFFGLKLTDEEYSTLQYTYSLHGRRVYTVDPIPEIIKRSEERLSGKTAYTNMPSQDEYWRLFKEGVRAAYGDLADRGRASWKGMSDFFQKRCQWAAGGAVTNIPPGLRYLKEPMELVVEVKDGLHNLVADVNKKALMERLKSPAEMAAMLYEYWGYNDTRTAPKPNEPAKKRVLIPGSLLHYIATTFILGIVEKSGDVGCVRLGDVDDINIHRYDMYIGMSLYNFMLDFADHNAQHSAPEMQYIMECLAEKAILQGADAQDVIWFTNWIIDSFDKMRILDPMGNAHSIKSGLYSGWRSTTWINSVACQAYIHVGVQTARAIYGKLDVRYYEAAGDDVIIAFGNCLDALRMYEVMLMCGFDMQDIKQEFCKGELEFLRMYTSGGRMFYCINRMLPNFICGDLERSNPDFQSRAAGGYSTCAALVRRGMRPEIANVLYIGFLKKWMRYREGDVYYEIPSVLLHGRAEDGGMGIPDIRGDVWELTKPIALGGTVVVRNIDGPCAATEDYLKVTYKEVMRDGATSFKWGAAKLASLKDVYGTAVKPIGDSIINTNMREFVKNPPRIRAAIRISHESDIPLLLEVVDMCQSPEVLQLDKQLAEYSRKRGEVAISDIPLWRIAVDAGLQPEAAEVVKELKAPIKYAFGAPEYMLHTIMSVVRYWVYVGRLRHWEVDMVVASLVVTYNQVFGCMI